MVNLNGRHTDINGDICGNTAEGHFVKYARNGYGVMVNHAEPCGGFQIFASGGYEGGNVFVKVMLYGRTWYSKGAHTWDAAERWIFNWINGDWAGGQLRLNGATPNDTEYMLD